MPFKCRQAFCAKDSKVKGPNAPGTAPSIPGPGTPGTPGVLGVKGVAKPLGMKRPGGGVNPIEVDTIELGDLTLDVAAGVVEREVDGFRTICTGACRGWMGVN